MFFRKKPPKRLYISTGRKWYTRPRRQTRASKTYSVKVFRGGIRTHFTRFFKNALLYVMIGALLLVIFVFLFFSSYLRIKNVEVVRENLNINSAAIENELTPFIGKNILFFQRQKAVDRIHQKFPEFSAVTVKKVLPKSLRIELKSYPIVANLRAYYVLPKQETPVEEFRQLERAINELQDAPISSPSATGTEAETAISPLDDVEVASGAFQLTPEVSSERFVEVKEDLTPIEQKCLINRAGLAIFDQEENLELLTIAIYGLEAPLEDRQQVMPAERMEYLLGALDYIKGAMHQEISAVKYLPIPRELHLKTADGLIVWLNMERDYKTQIDNLVTIYEPAELNKEPLSYIDLRIREKVIYCPQRAACAQPF